MILNQFLYIRAPWAQYGNEILRNSNSIPEVLLLRCLNRKFPTAIFSCQFQSFRKIIRVNIQIQLTYRLYTTAPISQLQLLHDNYKITAPKLMLVIRNIAQLKFNNWCSSAMSKSLYIQHHIPTTFKFELYLYNPLFFHNESI